MNTTAETITTIPTASIREYTTARSLKRMKFESSALPFITLSPLLIPWIPFADDHKRIKVVIDKIVGELP